MVDAIPDTTYTDGLKLSHVTVAKKKEQLREGIKVLGADPDGAKGYNAFVNEPAEASARTDSR